MPLNKETKPKTETGDWKEDMKVEWFQVRKLEKSEKKPVDRTNKYLFTQLLY